MRDISLEEAPAKLPTNTFLIYGASRTGKTRFAASFPRPLFLSDATEQGWETIKFMPEDEFFEPGVKPIVWGIEQMNDMAQAVERAKPLIASGRVQSVFVDSISFYADLYLNYIFGMQGANPDNRKAYGMLGQHLRDLRVKVHGLGVNVGWLALDRHPGDDAPRGGPLIPGQQSDKFCAGVNFVFYTRIENGKRENGKILSRTFEVRTIEFGPYVAGNRLGDSQLPDPFVGNYAALLAARGYDVDAIRKALPPLVATVGKGSTVVPIAKSASPPVIIRSAPKVVTVPPPGNGAPKGATK